MDAIKFWTFALERQAIWHRRFIEKLPAPWTQDVTLQKYKFTNCQRELDYGTQVLLKNLAEHTNAALSNKVLNIFLYRAYNVPDVPWVDNLTEAQSVIWDRNTRWENGEAMFTNAWMVTGGDYSPAVRLEKAAVAWKPEELVVKVEQASSLKTVFEAVRQVPFFGGVTVSWQVALDLTYIFKNVNDNEWIPEPSILRNGHRDKVSKTWDLREHGPRAAAKLIAPELSPLEVIHYLLNHQPSEWKKISWEKKPELSLADIEHTLCEFCKYQGISSGHRFGRKFIPRSR